MAGSFSDNYTKIGMLDGGMNKVWTVKGSDGKIAVAKECPKDDLVKMAFLNAEAGALSQLSHKDIPKSYGLFEGEASIYLVTEFVPGTELESRIGKPISEKEAMKISSSMTNTLGYVHSQGLMHRDIKPANILECADRTYKLIDFGSSQAPGKSIDSLCSSSEGYSAPEQIEGDCSVRSDIYSTAMTIKALLVGSSSPVASWCWDKTRSLNPDVSEKIAAVIDKAVSFDPKDRYATMQEFNKELQAAYVSERHRKIADTVVKPVTDALSSAVNYFQNLLSPAQPVYAKSPVQTI